MAKCVIDGTGHDSEICKTVARKNGIRLDTETGGVIGERSLDVIAGEEEVVKGTKEIYPGLYVCPSEQRPRPRHLHHPWP